MNNRHLLLPVLEAEKSKMKMPADSISGEGSLLQKWQLLAASSHGRRAKSAPFNLF
jgi:hypothetical protein